MIVLEFAIAIAPGAGGGTLVFDDVPGIIVGDFKRDVEQARILCVDAAMEEGIPPHLAMFATPLADVDLERGRAAVRQYLAMFN